MDRYDEILELYIAPAMAATYQHCIELRNEEFRKMQIEGNHFKVEPTR